MKLNKRIVRIASVILFPAMVMQTASCGTLLYPERRHSDIQADPGGRRIDPAVAALDAVCLVFFVIPGLIAFGVDFATGAIYFTKEKEQCNATTPEKPRKVVVHLVPDEMDRAALEQVISKEAGIAISFDDRRMHAFEINPDVPADILWAKLYEIDRH